MKNKLNLPKPECQLGYSDTQIREITDSRYDEFTRWMRGQTMAICDGRYYSHEDKQYYEDGCGPHGTIVYYWDVVTFLEGHPITD